MVLDLGRFSTGYRIEVMSSAWCNTLLDGEMVEFIDGSFWLWRFFAERIDTGVDCYLVKPGAHLCVPAKIFQWTKHFYEYLLGNILCFLMVSCDIVSEIIDFFLVLADQFMKGRVVSAAEAVNKNLLIWLHLFFTPIRRMHLSNGLQKAHQ